MLMLKRRRYQTLMYGFIFLCFLDYGRVLDILIILKMATIRVKIGHLYA